MNPCAHYRVYDVGGRPAECDTFTAQSLVRITDIFGIADDKSTSGRIDQHKVGCVVERRLIIGRPDGDRFPSWWYYHGRRHPWDLRIQDECSGQDRDYMFHLFSLLFLEGGPLTMNMLVIRAWEF